MYFKCKFLSKVNFNVVYSSYLFEFISSVAFHCSLFADAILDKNNELFASKIFLDPIKY